MANYQVIGIRTSTDVSSLQDITHIAYIALKWEPKFIITIEDAIERISWNKHEFYILGVTNLIYLTVIQEAGKTPYLKTKNSRGRTVDKLFALQRC